MQKEITELLEKTIHDTYRDNYPAIYLVVKKMIGDSKSPKMVRKLFEEKFPSDRLQHFHIELVAKHIFKSKNSN